jgi:hypothetical protein
MFCVVSAITKIGAEIGLSSDDAKAKAKSVEELIQHIENV